MDQDRPHHAPPVPGDRPILDNHQMSNFEGNLSDAITMSSGNPLDHDRVPPMFDERLQRIQVLDMLAHAPGHMPTASSAIARPESHTVPSAPTHGMPVTQIYTGSPGHAPHSIDPPYIQQRLVAHFHPGSQDFPPQLISNFNGQQVLPGAVGQAGMFTITLAFYLTHGWIDDMILATFSPFGGHPSPGFPAGQHENGLEVRPYSLQLASRSANDHDIQWGSDIRFQDHGFVGHHGNGGEFVTDGQRIDLVDTLQREESAPNTQPPSPGNRSRKRSRQTQATTIHGFGGSFGDGDDCAECRPGSIPHWPETSSKTVVQGEQGCQPQSKRRRKAPSGPKHNNSKQAGGTQKKSGKKNLTGEEKKEHHNNSEKARRQKLSKSFKRISWAAPAYGFGDSQNGRLLATEQWIKDLHSTKLILLKQLTDAKEKERTMKFVDAPGKLELLEIAG